MKVMLVVHGFVQGVGYRYLVMKNAVSLGIKGSVRNMPDGSVLILAEGTEEQILQLIRAIDISVENGPQVYKIERSNVKDGDYGAFRDFSIEH
ncbi:acylphosphatase [Candidatus Marsarchaeota archaeon]|jgi:Acylphosphatases|nr:acylphosphatase [Candidatus Marsarchaeota archaeon]MCL5092626.1 acylphosphatase [Candidatus Marsarchaeota archaeon]